MEYVFLYLYIIKPIGITLVLYLPHNISEFLIAKVLPIISLPTIFLHFNRA